MKIQCILICSVGLFVINLFGQEQVVHQAITANAEGSAYANSSAYFDFLNTVSSDLPRPGKNGAVQSMVQGSYHEDDYKLDAGGIRSYNHFYDPLDTTFGKGLSDVPTDTRDIAGTNSFAWASISNCAGFNYSGRLYLFGRNEHTTNVYSWQNARYFEWCGLTASNQLQRQTNLDAMFRSVGQVMHLLEDTTSPQHVRNEQHLDTLGKAFWESSIEDYGKTYCTNLNYGDGSMLDWRGGGFTKLEDFWNRYLYAPGNATVLQNAENGGAQLGLAEWCNGNFLGDRHKFAEYYPSKTSDIRYYPFPSRDSSTDYLQKRANPASGVGTFFFKNGDQGRGIYLNKTGDGVQFNAISRFTYLGAKFPNALGSWSTTIRDDNVLSNYHNVFIPKAVKYNAGLLDYFFRGTMDVSVIGYDTNLPQYTNLIVNTSGQDFSGGMFSIYQDDNSGNRTLVAQTNFSNQTLSDGESMTMTFPSSTPQSTNLVLVYQGTIGLTGDSPSDPVDANIGIAAERFMPWIEQTKTYHYQPYLSDLGLQPGATITTNLESDDFGFTPTAGNYEVKVILASFDDTGTIGDLSCHQIDGHACNNTMPDEITDTNVPVGNVTVVGNRLSVPVTATDDPICKTQIGWRNITITWRAWLGQ